MGKGALALLINGGSENWSSARWKARFDAVQNSCMHLVKQLSLALH